MRRHCKAFPLAAALAWALLASSHARAYEDQASLDGALGYMLLLDADGDPHQGPTLDLGAGFGLYDLGILRASAGYGALFADGTLRHAGRLRVEAVYLLDVLQFVPFFGIGAALVVIEGSPHAELRPGGHLVFGVDYLLSRSWLLGLDLRSGALLDGGRALSVTDVGLRVSRTFETF